MRGVGARLGWALFLLEGNKGLFGAAACPKAANPSPLSVRASPGQLSPFSWMLRGFCSAPQAPSRAALVGPFCSQSPAVPRALLLSEVKPGHFKALMICWASSGIRAPEKICIDTAKHRFHFLAALQRNLRAPTGFGGSHWHPHCPSCITVQNHPRPAEEGFWPSQFSTLRTKAPQISQCSELTRAGCCYFLIYKLETFSLKSRTRTCILLSTPTSTCLHSANSNSRKMAWKGLTICRISCRVGWWPSAGL